jgi:hypothetical protein
VEHRLDKKRRDKQYEAIVGLRLAEEYTGKWKQIGGFLVSLKRPEGNPTNEMQLFRRETTIYLVSDAVLYRMWKDNKLPVLVLVSIEKRIKAMVAAHELRGHHGREETL